MPSDREPTSQRPPPARPGDQAGAAGDALRRGRRLLLTEAAFARVVGATLSGLFLTALVRELGGGAVHVGIALAAGQIGSMGMLLANPIINRIGSRRVFCLISLAVVRSLRMVVAALPVLAYLGVARTALFWPVVACVLLSALFGMSAEISRRSWISALVPPGQRGGFLSRRIMIGSVTSLLVSLAGGRFLDAFDPPAKLAGIAMLIGFGAVMGWTGWSLLLRAPEPVLSVPRRPIGLRRSLALPWRRPRFRPLVIAGAANAFAVGICGGFFHLYMLQHLGMKAFWVAAVDTVGELAALVGAPFYGAWADRSGARRVLATAMVVKGVFPALWILVAPETWPLAFAVVVLRTFNSAGQISWLRLSLDLSHPRNQAAYLSMHQAIMGAGMAAGALAGGAVAGALEPVDLGVLAGIRIVPLHVLFAASAVLRLASLTLLRFIREPQRVLNAAGAARG